MTCRYKRRNQFSRANLADERPDCFSKSALRERYLVGRACHRGRRTPADDTLRESPLPHNPNNWNKTEAGKAYYREWTKANREKVRIIHYRNRLKRYGITPEEFWELVKSQDHKCAICRCVLLPPGQGHKLNANGMNLDHDHETDRVRGVLCATCNRGLGQFKDDADVLDAASAYLRAFTAKKLTLVAKKET